jgi:hypothetical protein
VIRCNAVEHYADLPDLVIELLTSIKAPERLVAHLTLVHDVATKLIKKIKREYPDLQLDEQAVLFGAATHDIGKTSFPAELVGPGSMHEECGAEMDTILSDLARDADRRLDWQSKFAAA